MQRLACGAALLAAAASELPPAQNPQALFDEFIRGVGREYASEEEREARFAVFVENLANIAAMREHDPDAAYSHVTMFADWSVGEFAAWNTLSTHQFDASGAQKDDQHDVTALPAAFDWVEKGAVNEVKNQAQCGSCWAFSTVANIEGVNFVKTGKLLSLSEQELVDCDKGGKQGDQGCQGGLPSNAFQYMIGQHVGLEPEAQYPYKARDGTCQAQKADEVVFISAWKQIASDEAQMAAALMQYGPLSIGINANAMQWYFGGVANPLSLLCNPKSIDHGVALVGFGSDPKEYWKIRNSWGPSWGEKGYYRLVRGVNKCGLTTMVTTATIGGAEALVV